MSQYFDRDFFKFLLGFVSIILLSLVIILVAQIYKENSKDQTPVAEQSSLRGTAASVVQSVKTP